MSLSDYTLVYAGEEKTLAEWGIDSARLQLQVGGDDSLTFTTKEGLTTAPAFTGRAEVRLKDTSGTTLFVGPVFPKRQGYMRVYVVPGGNYWLRRCQLSQEWQAVIGMSFGPKTVSLGILGARALNDDVAAIVATVNAKGGSVTLDTTDLPTDLSPRELQRNISAYDAIRRLLGWRPYMDYRWDYSTGTPKLQFFSVLPTGHGFGDLADNRFPVQTISLGGSPGDPERDPAPTFDPQWELQKHYCTIYWRSRKAYTARTTTPGTGEVEIPATGTGLTDGQVIISQAFEEDTVTADNDAFGGVELTIELARGEWDGAERQPDELKVEGLALRMGAAHFRLWYAMQWQETRDTCNFDRAPGVLVNADGADPAFATANSVTQSVTHDLATGQTSVTTGAPTQLGFYDPLLQNRLRMQANASDSGAQTFGFEPREDADQESDAAATKYFPPHPFKLCVNADHEVYVNPDSTVTKGFVADNEIAVSGLGTSHAISGTTYVYLRADLSGGAVAGVSVVFAGSLWTDYPAAITVNLVPDQTAAYALLGIVQAYDSDYPERETFMVGAVTYQIRQIVTTHQNLALCCYEGGEDRLLFVPGNGAGPAH